MLLVDSWGNKLGNGGGARFQKQRADKMTSVNSTQQQARLTSDPLIGQVIDRYRLVEGIGDGAMANVYRAQHTTLTDRRYAVKVLRPNMARKPQVAARFRREARILSQIEHPNIVAVIDAGTTAHGLLYMVLEYAEGKTLNNSSVKLARWALSGRPTWFARLLRP